MDLLQLQYFQITAQHEHITMAANRLHISQPALSKTIKKLEEELGVPLFDRHGKNITLNDNGKIFLSYVNTALDALSNGKRQLSNSVNETLPNILLNAEVGADFLVPLVTGFNKIYPQIKLFVRKENTKLLYPIMKYDLAIMMQTSDQELPPGSISLFEEDFMLAVPNGHPFTQKLYVNLEDLKNERFAMFQKTSAYRIAITRFCHTAGFEPEIAYECHDWRMLCDYVRSNICISIVPKYSWQSCMEGIQMIPIRDLPISRRIILSWFDDAHLTKSSKLFVDFVLQYCTKNIRI
ncbi:LysR family transcriptional regulator [Lachnospiraceae bacterium CLA-AA-H215]|uniref:LysR family transcriptional regulator n=1 Tax=Hominifimenecus microfluidus TaxID=2885348 RepID=A0AAE3E7R3_9FIRM|nr:LysR family transcriptional regulator [Hominifimenecus microfluidus]MCC2229678.1 LysR family transcriptional regulator [Hominifimenecus microfluidus]